MSIFGPVPGMRTMRFRAKSLKKYENTWLAACPSRIAKNVPTVFVFYCKNVLEKMEVGLRSPKTRPLKPHLSSGNAENEFLEIRIEHNVFRTFSKSEQKRWKKRHGTAAPRPEKRVKTGVFRNIFETSNKNKQILAWSENDENAWKRVNTRGFEHVLSCGSPKMSPVKPHLSLGMPKTSFRKIPEARRKHRIRGQISKNAWKRVVFATFRKKRRKTG